MTARYSRRALALLLLVAGSIRASGADEPELSRIVPAPADQPIPAVDFFRPPLLYGARLNRSGTHLAGLGSMDRDSTALFVYNLATNKFGELNPGDDEDIYSFSWLDDDRLLYTITDKKLYDLAMLAVNLDQLSHSYALIQYWGAVMVGIPERRRQRPLIWMRFDGFNGNIDRGVAEIRTDLNIGPMFDLRAASGASVAVHKQVEHANEQHVVAHYPIPPDGLDAG